MWLWVLFKCTMDKSSDYQLYPVFDSTSEVVEIFMGISVMVIFCVLLHYLCRLVFFDCCYDNQDNQQFQTALHTINSSNFYEKIISVVFITFGCCIERWALSAWFFPDCASNCIMSLVSQNHMQICAVDGSNVMVCVCHTVPNSNLYIFTVYAVKSRYSTDFIGRMVCMCACVQCLCKHLDQLFWMSSWLCSFHRMQTKSIGLSLKNMPFFVDITI